MGCIVYYVLTINYTHSEALTVKSFQEQNPLQLAFFKYTQNVQLGTQE